MKNRFSTHHTFIIFLVFLLNYEYTLADATLQVEPTVSYVGSYCTLIPERTEFAGVQTDLRIQSTEESWTLYLTLTETIRRASDGQDLPLQRIQQFFPSYIPEQILNFQPYAVLDGQADSSVRSEEFVWLPLQMALLDFLQETDPPGLYRTYLRFDLLNAQGEPLCLPIDVSVEFEIIEAATVELLPDETTVEVQFNHSDYGHGESFITEVLVRSNSDWTLTFRSLAEGLSGDHGQLPLDALSLRVEGSPGDQWTSWLPDNVPVSQEPITVASGEQPPLFRVSEIRIPIVFASDVSISHFSGRYELPFEVKVTARDVSVQP